MQKEKIVNILNSQLGDGYINSNGESIHKCPFCNHHKKKLQIEIETQRWHCWVCNSKGRTIVKLLKLINSPKYIIEEIAQYLPKKIKNFEGGENKIQYSSIKLPKEFISLAIPSESQIYKLCINYLLKRKITYSDIIKYNLGYCVTGEYAHMVIIPSYDKHGNLNFFTAHAFSGLSKFKFKNPKLNKNIITFASTIAETEPIVLVESPFDAISVRRNSIPLNGKTLSDSLKQYIIESDINEIIICLDGDALKSSIKTCSYFLSLGKKVFLVELDYDKDPNDLGHDEIWKKIKETQPLNENTTLMYNLKVKFNAKYK
jgi:DNA primase